VKKKGDDQGADPWERIRLLNEKTWSLGWKFIRKNKQKHPEFHPLSELLRIINIYFLCFFLANWTQK
jgi:hypothetical protein